MSVMLGITGGIACGKSEAGRILERHGVAVLDTDEVAHQVMEPGAEAHAAVVGEFGEEILDGEGRIDRTRLGALVFGDPDRRKRLNALVHPAVRARWQAWREEQRAQGRHGAVLIPLLFEVGADRGWDAIVCLTADPETVRERMRARGHDDADMERRIASQWPVSEKAARSDFIIENNGSIEQLEHEVLRVLQACAVKEKEA